MQRIPHRTITQLAVGWQRRLSSATQLALTVLCGLLLASGALAQEQRPAPPPEPSTPEAAATEKAPDPNETLTPNPLASQVVDGDIIFTSPGQFTYPRDIRLSDNFGGLRFYGADALTTSPAGAAIQFFGNNATNFPGQLYLDSGAHNNAALIFRTAQTDGTISERMRVTSDGNVGIGKTTTDTLGGTRLDVRTEAGGPLTAVSATSTNPNGVGVFGTATGDGSIGIWGLHNFNGIAVLGRSIGGQGVYGLSSSNQGVYGQSLSGVGVYGVSQNNDSVVGISSSNVFSGVVGANTGTGAGVYGENLNANGHAGYFVGRVRVTGNLTKGGGSFKIDHPLDPSNKYLSHSFVESPDMMNIYNGIIVLDAKGQATVTLPQWFDALNKDFRYQLTAVGAPGPNLYIARKIKGNQFKIAGGKRGMEVSWLVTGVRQDAYANAHRIRVEEEKPAKERGTYLHPEAFGQPREKGVERAQQPEPSQRLTAASTQRKEN